jgi:hypothetical protein
MAMNNTTTKKSYNNVKPMPAERAEPTKDVNSMNRDAMYTGQLKGRSSEDFANPMNMGAPSIISGISGTYNDIGEVSGFITDGYMEKNGTPYGEAAKFNYLPPGMDISNQMNAEIHAMPMRMVVEASYPGDGWMPMPRDIEE